MTNEFWLQVLIRIRPLSSTERASQGYGRCLKQESSQTLLWLGHPETRFTFDHIACEQISQVLFKIQLFILVVGMEPSTHPMH